MKAREDIAIFIAAQEGVDKSYIDWVQFGLEEESIPYERMDVQEEDPKVLADLAKKKIQAGHWHRGQPSGLFLPKFKRL